MYLEVGVVENLFLIPSFLKERIFIPGFQCNVSNENKETH